MIAYLEGTVLHREDDRIVLLCGAVGYEVHVTRELFLKAREKEPLSLWVFHTIREDRPELYGFSRRAERDLFLLLLKVQQIGTKLAMNLLNAYPPEKLAEIVVTENHRLLSQVSGIGNKTAQRIIVELKDRLKALPALKEAPVSPLYRDTLEALVVLGYAPRDAAQELEVAMKNHPGVTRVEEFLQLILSGAHREPAP